MTQEDPDDNLGLKSINKLSKKINSQTQLFQYELIISFATKLRPLGRYGLKYDQIGIYISHSITITRALLLQKVIVL